jgi:hypothetical protein
VIFGAEVAEVSCAQPEEENSVKRLNPNITICFRIALFSLKSLAEHFAKKPTPPILS